MARKSRFMGVAAGLLVLGLVAGACGSDDNSDSATDTTASGSATTVASNIDCATGTVSGAGSSFVANIAQQWIKDYGNECSGATINYQSVGSGAGIQQFSAGTVDFGASDAVMKPEEEQAAVAKGGEVLHIPVIAGAVVLEYNLPGVEGLKLSADTIAGIFAGKITKWNDSAIAGENSGATLPSTGITVVHRSDGSGTTDIFTKYMTAAAPSVWTFGAGKEVPWPAGQGAKGSEGVTAAVKQTEGAIGYSELSYAESNNLGVAQVKDGAGEYVAPTSEAVSKALEGADVPADLKLKINYTTTTPGAYPIAGTTWALVFKKQTDAKKGALLKSFLTYALGDGQKDAESLFYAPLPSGLAQKALAAVESIEV